MPHEKRIPTDQQLELPMESGIETAIRMAGGQKQLALRLDVTQQFVSKCYSRGYVPLDRAIQIETLLGIDRKRLINPRILEAVGE